MNWGYVSGYFDGEGHVSIILMPGTSATKASLSFANTNLESLEAIRCFVQCGAIRAKQRTNNPLHKQGYSLHIEAKEEVVRVAIAMVEHCIVKKPALLQAINVASTRIKPTGKRGALATIGHDEIARLYNSGLSINDLADHVGVTYSAVRRFMERNRIPRRSFDDPICQRTEWTEESKRKASESRRILWRNPEYRAKAVAGMRTAHASDRAKAVAGMRTAHASDS